MAAWTGRLLLRGSNGTGKTTLLEALFPYLLTLDSRLLRSGRNRHTTLTHLMAEGALGKRRFGYLWLAFASPSSPESQPDPAEVHSYGVRLEFNDGATTPVVLVPFRTSGTAPAVLTSHGAFGEPIAREVFTTEIEAAGGEVFDDVDAYVEDLAQRVYGCTAAGLRKMADRIHRVRNPHLLAVLTPHDAERELRSSLPSVSEEVVSATGQALASAERTRLRYMYEASTADRLDELARAWTGVVVGRVAACLKTERAAAEDVATSEQQLTAASAAAASAQTRAEDSAATRERLCAEEAVVQATVAALSQDGDLSTADRLQRARAARAACAEAYEVRCKNVGLTLSLRLQQASRVREMARVLQEDLQAALEGAARPPSAPGAGPVRLAIRSLPDMTIGDRTFPAGELVDVSADPAAAEALAAELEAGAQEQESRCQRATAAKIAHEPVDDASTRAQEARQEAAQDARLADLQREQYHKAAQTAHAAATDALNEVTAWGKERLPARTPRAWDGAKAWSAPSLALQLEEWQGLEPALVAEHLESLRQQMEADADEERARARARGARHAGRADAAAETGRVAEAEADAWRDGRLPSFPRPAWQPDLPTAEEKFGELVQWRPRRAPGEGRERDLLEAVIAATGLLSATLRDGELYAGAHWSVTPYGPSLPQSLSDVLQPVPGHPRAEEVDAVLARIALLPTAAAIFDDTSSALVIGRDGTYRAGVLGARIPAADEPALLEEAQYIGMEARQRGARRREEAARRRAIHQRALARHHRAAALRLEDHARAITHIVSCFPAERISCMRAAEQARTAAAQADAAARAAARASTEKAQQLEEAHRKARSVWRANTERMGLPTDIAQLIQVVADSTRQRDVQQRACAGVRRLIPRMRDLNCSVTGLPATDDELERAVDEARSSHHELLAAEADVTAREQQCTPQVLQAQQRLDDAMLEAQHLAEAVKQAQKADDRARDEQARTEERLRAARDRHHDTRPALDAARWQLQRLLVAPGVRMALGAEQLPDALDDAAVRHLGELLACCAPPGSMAAAVTEAERCWDKLRDHLSAQGEEEWHRSHGITHEDLPAYQLSRDGKHYDPPQAVFVARARQRHALEAFTSVEDKLIEQFVLSQLPSAIGRAWQELEEWTKKVNTNMALAAASSGLRVKVELPLRGDLPDSLRTIHELCCRTSDAARTPEQQEHVGQEVLAEVRLKDRAGTAADDDRESIEERLRSVVDIRSWITVRYMITRDGGTPERWGSRTTLSKGESRLVALAPMLAALATAHTELSPTAPRIMALDEVPAEVDDQGRDGLARYLASLDLDVICTSHQWDGSPDAWDGIDCYDLERIGALVLAEPMSSHSTSVVMLPPDFTGATATGSLS
ncbi:SbcC/MukB-like Walker B domain-containing protein [Streptomyces abikoensis]|uniref:SbcC/MukB-like Walker B domain-containing protein n=1 Tax=Streptomyces abikoensis TaxID=97398 RepID=A0ABW7TCQ4_9ACTN